MVANTEFLGLGAAARRFNIDGKCVHLSTIFRWMRTGVVVRGRRVRLGAVRLGRRLTTTPELIETFRRELTEAESAEPIPRPQVECQPVTPKSRTPAQRQRDIERARVELQEA